MNKYVNAYWEKNLNNLYKRMSHEIDQLEIQKYLYAYVLSLIFVLRTTGWMPQTATKCHYCAESGSK